MQTAIDELIRREPANFEGYFWGAFLAIQQRNNYDAVRLLRRAESLKANSYVLKLLAIAYYTLDQFQLFTQTMHRAIQARPEDFAPYYYLGRYYVSSNSNDFARAADYFNEALKRNPDHPSSRYYLGYCDEIGRELDSAEKEYARSTELSEAAGEKFALPYQGIARIRLLEDKPAEALEAASRAVGLAPNDSASHIVRAKALDALHRGTEASAEWERAATLDPTDVVICYHLYQSYSALGRKEKASAMLAQYRKLSAMYGNAR